jgi:hypothetical protein
MNQKIPTKEEFLEMLPAIRETARKLGYAIGLHGSLERDFDLIAAPWTEDAVHSDDIAEAIKTATKCVRWRVYRDQGDVKPHGRIVYCFDWDQENYENRGYIDLSVMPRIIENNHQQKSEVEMKKFLFLVGLLILAVLFAGCGTITVKEIDPNSGKVIRETVSEGTGVIIASTQNKSIYAFRSGWFFLFELSPGTPDNPTPHATADGGCLDSGILLLHKDQQNIQGVADIIKAGRSSFTASATGASSNVGNPETQGAVPEGKAPE